MQVQLHNKFIKKNINKPWKKYLYMVSIKKNPQLNQNYPIIQGYTHFLNYNPSPSQTGNLDLP